MTQTDLIEALAARLKISRRLAQKLFKIFWQEIAQALVRGERVELRGFGVFQVRRLRPRKYKHPRSGKEFVVPARRKAVFKPGKRFVSYLNEE